MGPGPYSAVLLDPGILLFMERAKTDRQGSNLYTLSLSSDQLFVLQPIIVINA